MNILITGSSGFVGRNLVMSLSKNHRVVGLSRNPGADISQNILDLGHKQIGDILENHNIELVIHCAADIETKSLESFYLNSFALQKFFSHPLGRQKRYLVIGSAAECGEFLNIDEAENTPLPTSYYGASKLLQTALAQFNADRYGIKVQVLRAFNLIAPQMNIKTFVGHVMHEALRGENGKIVIDNGGKLRDFVDIRDFIDAVDKIIQVNPGRDFLLEVGSGKLHTYKEFVDKLCEILTEQGKKIPYVNFLNNVNTYSRAAEYGSLQQLYGWTPRYTLANSLSWCIEEQSKENS